MANGERPGYTGDASDSHRGIIETIQRPGSVPGIFPSDYEPF